MEVRNVFFKLKKGGTFMCKKLEDIHKKKPSDFLLQNNELPVNIEEILISAGINVLATDFSELQQRLPIKRIIILGIAYAKMNDLFILYSSKSDIFEKRFTLAHELGHCCLHMNADSACHVELQTKYDFLELQNSDLKIIKEQKEEEADKFARDLLIPTEKLSKILCSKKEISIEELANAFAVPLLQMQKKLEDMISG